jgi:hypothetical protein
LFVAGAGGEIGALAIDGLALLFCGALTLGVAVGGGGLFLGGLLTGEGFAAGVFELGLTFGGGGGGGLFVEGACGELGALTICGFALLFRGALEFGGG